ncbi:hypothetical protein SSX86_000176 [Deinandra increscens subsp. villosa]|uniref:P-loop containing nucleoside triphosphate hydrolase protein n=1 Tax=Deinandra increscens subsp. villosa TaxID=3103831 RepID=A0AAP0DW55_9ASTR
MDREGTRPQRVIVAMKGHPGSGKTTLARFIAASLGCPLIDKDDVRDSTLTIESQFEHTTNIKKLLNDLSYQVIWRMVETQLSLGLSVVIDSPLSHRAHFDRLAKLAESFGGTQLVVVECRPKDEVEWRHRVENRGKDGCDGSWHKPATWRDMERLLEGYDGRTDYDTGEVPKLVLNTTATDVKVTEHAEFVLRFLDACIH